MQGLGLFTMEQCVYLEGSKGAQRGQLFTTGPGTYKIPSCQDIPLDFRVALLGRSPNPKAIFSSKVQYINSEHYDHRNTHDNNRTILPSEFVSG